VIPAPHSSLFTPTKMSEAEKSKAQLVIVTGLVIFSFIFKSAAVYLLYAAGIVGVLSIFIPVVGDFIVKIWFKIAEGLGWFNSRVILSIMFFVFLWPISMLYRLFTKNPMGIKRPAGNSVYVERNHTYVKKDMENIW
jgi:Saxitoxin biosynthesis operon protein SxtJ